jgi:hypothetical protein
MAEIKFYLDRLQRVAPGNVEAHNLRAIWLFVVNRDVSGAIGEVEKCSSREDAM